MLSTILSATEKEFRQTLNHAESTYDLEQCTLKLINYLGRSNYSFFRLDTVNSFSDRPIMMPRVLMSGHHCDNSCRSGILLQAKPANIATRHLAMLYHFVASAALGSSLLSKCHIQYVLVTSASHHDYYITPTDTQSINGQNISVNGSVIQHENTPQDETARALHLLANAIAYTGSRRFPTLFLRGTGAKKVSVNAQPQRLLNILALNDVTLQQAADQLNLTVNTVNKHMATAKDALGTHTIAGTLWQAINEGLING